jgi:DHA1 family bicyclomycin/chloramphenicol resistance-like MFS transporter
MGEIETPDLEQRETRRRWIIPKRSAAVLAIIILLNALPALATDMYLAALPEMSIELDAPVSLLNLNLILFFLFYGIGLLLWGPLSDKYGRRPTLIVGMTAFVIFSVLCGLSTNVYELIIFRALQGIFGGVAVAVSTAMVRDIYDGHQRERAFAMVSMMMALGPVIAPIVGAALLQVITWNGIFFLLAAIGLIALAGCILMEESISQRADRRVLAALAQLGVILKNRKFSNLLPSLSPLGMIIFVWVGTSTYILIDDFGLSKGEFSLFFAANGMFLLIGPFLYLVLARYFDRLKIVAASIAVIAISGILIMTLGELGPIPFLLSVIPATLAVSITRPPSFDIALSQVDTDIGSASSVFNFLFMAIGAGGMMIASLEWQSRIAVMGIIFAIVGIFSLFAWLAVYRQYSSEPEESHQLEPVSGK